MNDFDTKIKALFNEHVDERTGARPAAPPFDQGRKAERPGDSLRLGRSPWLFPLVAAAAVIAVAAGTVGAAQLLGDKRNSPATTGPTPAPVTATRTGAPSPEPTSVSPTKPKSSSSVRTSAPLHGKVVLAGASIRLPRGWVARDFAQYLRPDESTAAAQQWCLTPASRPVSTAPFACQLTLGTIPTHGNSVDVDTEGGWSSNPEYCYGPPVSETPHVVEQSGDLPFGSRTADWRRWVITCRHHQPAHYDIEQYVVATRPGFILYSDHADAAMHAVMTDIVASAKLPAQQPGIRFMDRGFVRRIETTTGGIRIALDRVVRGENGIVNNNPATYDYVIPAAVADRNLQGLKKGQLVNLFTDGTHVIEAYRS